MKKYVVGCSWTRDVKYVDDGMFGREMSSWIRSRLSTGRYGPEDIIHKAMQSHSWFSRDFMIEISCKGFGDTQLAVDGIFVVYVQDK